MDRMGCTALASNLKNRRYRGHTGADGDGGVQLNISKAADKHYTQGQAGMITSTLRVGQGQVVHFPYYLYQLMYSKKRWGAHQGRQA